MLWLVSMAGGRMPLEGRKVSTSKDHVLGRKAFMTDRLLWCGFYLAGWVASS